MNYINNSTRISKFNSWQLIIDLLKYSKPIRLFMEEFVEKLFMIACFMSF